MYDSRPHSVIITLGRQLYRIPEIAPPTAISLIHAKNIFHTLCTKLGIKDSERHLVLKYHVCLHRYIQTEMDFLDIESLGVAYRYVVNIEHKFKQKR